MKQSITPLILTFNEAPNIERSLQRLLWAKNIVVIDSFSTDETLTILQAYSQVQVFQRSFDSFAQQCNFGLSNITTEWVLSLDADYILSDLLIAELNQWVPSVNINGYFVRFRYCVFGKPLRGTLLPPRQVLYRRTKAIYYEDGHAHRVHVEGQSTFLSGTIEHDDRKSLSRWLASQDRYMVQEAAKLMSTPLHELSWGDRLRKQKIIAPFVILVYCLLLKGGLWDGWAGWYYAFQRLLAEILLALRLLEAEQDH